MGKKSLKEAYITRVLAPVEDADAQEEMALELSVHIDERIEFYKEIGYDDETAEKKAVEDMGDPEPVGASLSRLHPKGRIITAILAVLPMLPIFFCCGMFYLLYCLEDRGLWFGIWETASMLYLLFLSWFGRKRNNRFLCALPIITYAVLAAVIVYFRIMRDVLICSPFVLVAACLLTGDFTCLRTYPYVVEITVPMWLEVISVLFYLFVFAVFLAAEINARHLQKPIYSRQDKQAGKRLAVLQRILMVAVAAVAVCNISVFLVEGPAEHPSEMTAGNFESILIVQSDSPVETDAVSLTDVVILNRDYEMFTAQCRWGNRSWDISDIKVEASINTDSVACGEKLEYAYWVFREDCVVTKPYVYIGFVDEDDYGVDYADGDSSADSDSAYGNRVLRYSIAPEDWQKTETVGTLTRDGDSYNRVEIVINDARE